MLDDQEPAVREAGAVGLEERLAARVAALAAADAPSLPGGGVLVPDGRFDLVVAALLASPA
eukprot:8194604-Lingulodinium_polyedra.AAC.1